MTTASFQSNADLATQSGKRKATTEERSDLSYTQVQASSNVSQPQPAERIDASAR